MHTRQATKGAGDKVVFKMTRNGLDNLMWEQADTLISTSKGFTFVVTVDGVLYSSDVYISPDDLPGGEEGPDHDSIYSNDFAPYQESLDNLLAKISQ